MNEHHTQRRGVESLPISLKSVHSSSIQRATGYEEQLDDERLYITRMPSSARRYQTTDPRQHPQSVVTQTQRGKQHLRQPDRYDDVRVYVHRNRRHAPQQHQQQQQPMQASRPVRQPVEPEQQVSQSETEPLRRPRSRSRMHWMVYLGSGMLLVLLLWTLLAAILSWWRGEQDNLHYGYPRTLQIDAHVGHQDAVTPSHFIALNLHGHIEVIEFPGGDATHTRVYLGPTLSGEGSDLDIVTVSFRDVNGDGKPDMLLLVNGITYVYLNENGAFRSLMPGEHVTV